MIKIGGNTIEPGAVGQYPAGSVERQVLDIMAGSSETYRFDSLDRLKFELEVRKSIVNAAKELNDSGISFKVFRKSKANPDYWHRTDEGGFMLQPNVTPWDAINDIYRNGHLYGTECSTAMLIVYFKALADVLPKELFNQLFPDIYLMNWQHLDRDLGIRTVEMAEDYFPGDARYFKNPEVDPVHPEWQGENVFSLGGDLYFGHGIGIATGEKIIDALNSLRREGATKTAYLMDRAERPDFDHLYRKYKEYKEEPNS